MVTLSAQLASFSIGGAVSFPSVLIEQVQLNGTSVYLDVDNRSWIGSIYGLSGIPAALMPVITQKYGRKCGYLLACSCGLLGWMLTLIANSRALIFASESFHGLATNCLLQVACLSLSEMSSPKYRILFMQLTCFMMVVGMTTSGILGRFCHFQTISLIMLVPVVIAIILGVLWPESPPWLAWKGELSRCEKNFVWLRGTDENSNKELNELLMTQRENLSLYRNQKQSLWKKFWAKISRRDFYMPSFHIFMLMTLMYWSGADVIFIYFMDMVKQSTQNENAAFHSSIAMYSIIVCGAFVTNFSSTRFLNKTVLLFSSSGVTLCLFCASFVSALQSVGVISKDSLTCMYILMVYTVFNGLGMTAYVFIIGSELMPVKHRSLGGAVYIISNCVLYASTQKISPYLLTYVGMWGTFLIFALNGVICGGFVWKYVPETKGRTLQEIEYFYCHGKYLMIPAMTDLDGAIELNDTKLSDDDNIEELIHKVDTDLI